MSTAALSEARAGLTIVRVRGDRLGPLLPLVGSLFLACSLLPVTLYLYIKFMAVIGLAQWDGLMPLAAIVGMAATVTPIHLIDSRFVGRSAA
jgi:hypothetical protein